jgi:hypothetical protein
MGVCVHPVVHWEYGVTQVRIACGFPSTKAAEYPELPPQDSNCASEELPVVSVSSPSSRSLLACRSGFIARHCLQRKREIGFHA